ncbi:secretogranin-2-like [Pimephales promelas]|uniref:secretogranin-2-like n=1 Tax=Pimephales promelas TaxID=90988 RepID=UPI001955C07B|nr:secretogranin-2-like [Pimephales promelas]
MSSSSRCCATGVFVLPSLLLLPLFLSLVFGVQGATLREHRLSGSEPVSYGPASQIRPPPSAEMLRALRYIQSLSQRSLPPDPLTDERQPDEEEDDMESIRSMLQLAAPGRMDRGMEETEDERDNTQELLQAVLKTLQQTEEHKVPKKVIATQPQYTIHPFPRPKPQLEVETPAENYGRTSWANQDSRRQHRQYPIMFEDPEDQEQPLKRTNENAEEQYTPQKLATLQSVFEELSGISTSKLNNKRDDGEDDEEEDDNDDNDLYRQRKMALEDIMGTDEWEPLEEQIETEEEERERHGFNRDLDDDDQEEDEDEVKRSNQSSWKRTGTEEDPEDIAKLMDYYLLQVLEKKEQEQQKRQEASRSEQETNRELERKDVDEDEDEVEEEEEEREIKPMRNTFPESLSQIIKLSQQLRIPPKEVLDLLQNERQKNLLGQSRTPYGYATTHNTHKTFSTAPHRVSPLETSERNGVAQDILSILELVNAAQQNNKRPTQPNVPRYYERETSKDDYDNTAGEEDELASYLASEMLAQGQRRARPTPLRNVDQPRYGNLERAVQDYFDKGAPEKRTAEHENADIGLDNNTMMKILRLLEPESDNTDETDSEEKTVPEM